MGKLNVVATYLVTVGTSVCGNNADSKASGVARRGAARGVGTRQTVGSGADGDLSRPQEPGRGYKFAH